MYAYSNYLTGLTAGSVKANSAAAFGLYLYTITIIEFVMEKHGVDISTVQPAQALKQPASPKKQQRLKSPKKKVSIFSPAF